MAATMITQILNKASRGSEITPAEGYLLLTASYPPDWLRQAADELRRNLVGEAVSYVVNRNINFTNICEQHCGFCAFRRDENQPDSYGLTPEQIVLKVEDAVQRGATEICLQGGLNPAAKRHGRTLDYYVHLAETIKTTAPGLHLHAFSPQEIQFISRQEGISINDVL
ncbi:MAG: radical SAM protein, partial [Gloeomargarita sp. DG_2_bins_126]